MRTLQDFCVCEVDKSLKSNLHSVFSQIICFHQPSGADSSSFVHLSR